MDSVKFGYDFKSLDDSNAILLKLSCLYSRKVSPSTRTVCLGAWLEKGGKKYFTSKGGTENFLTA